ncbi:dynein axonemal intermediate chain 1-like [Portunus trituberculatus]|uniref:dynein axonemal intermediate chain 1-like n=1 Tax=Portunus trituberculatus TaxID=210409 RepID=UPI001E1CBF73|nr:dynein axonemal intermediate chain 1-like [Portunus trituberculatus]
MLARVAPKLRLRRREEQGDEEGEGEHTSGSLLISQSDAKIPIPQQQGTREPEVTIRLSSNSARLHNQVRYDLTCGSYRRVLVSEDDLTLDLLTLPSRIIHRDLHDQIQQKQQQEKQHDKQSSKEDGDEARRLMEEVYRDMVNPEDLAKLDSQPNPFNFSERVSQTNRFSKRNLSMQTEAPPSTTFGLTVSPALIQDAYLENYENQLEKEMERELEERERDRGNKGRETPPPGSLDPLELTGSTGQRHGQETVGLAGLSHAAKVVERMVNQNTYDDITQDFRYWEDGSDEFRPLEGSLLPLWKFTHDGSRHLIVTDVCWSPIYSDLFAAAYAPADEGGGGSVGGGMLCLYTLKNPSTPERVFRAPCGVTCMSFHPQYGSVLAAGWADGTVVVYEARPPGRPGQLSSSTGSGKHLLPVSQVQWVSTDPGEDLCLYSVAQDGRLTQWHVHSSVLVHTDLLMFKPDQPQTPASQDRVMLEGRCV